MPRIVLLALFVVGLFVALVLARRGSADEPAAAPGRIVLVGDSLNVGIERYLAQELRGWTIRADDRVGRGTDDGLEALAKLRGSEPVVVSLGTNDLRGAANAFAADVARALRIAGDGRCVIWATIWRDGGPDEAFNAVLEQAAAANPELRLLRWDDLLEGHPDWLAADGIHGTPEGNAGRAAAAAALVRTCEAGG